jgi:hypothetical protein
MAEERYGLEKFSDKLLFVALMIVLLTIDVARLIRAKLTGAKLDRDLPWIGASVNQQSRPAE